MEHVKVIGIKEFQLLLRRHLKKKERHFKTAVRKAIKRGAEIVKRRTPKAFGELRESIHTTEHSIVIDAPHAAAVEKGSRPHWVPIDALVRWVKLRHIQGVQLKKGIERRRGSTIGPTTRRQARSIFNEMKRFEKKGVGYDDAVLEVAKAIQHSIANKVTPPYNYALNSLPILQSDLDKWMKKAADQTIA